MVSLGVSVHLIPSGNLRIFKVVSVTKWMVSHQCRERTQEYIFKVFPPFSSLTVAYSYAHKTSCATLAAFFFAGVGFANCVVQKNLASVSV